MPLTPLLPGAVSEGCRGDEPPLLSPPRSLRGRFARQACSPPSCPQRGGSEPSTPDSVAWVCGWCWLLKLDRNGSERFLTSSRRSLLGAAGGRTSVSNGNRLRCGGRSHLRAFGPLRFRANLPFGRGG